MLRFTIRKRQERKRGRRSIQRSQMLRQCRDLKFVIDGKGDRLHVTPFNLDSHYDLLVAIYPKGILSPAEEHRQWLNSRW